FVDFCSSGQRGIQHFSTNIKRQHQCDGCEKSYSSSANLRRHKRVECGKEKKFKCYHCEKAFYHKSHLKYHLSAHMKKMFFNFHIKNPPSLLPKLVNFAVVGIRYWCTILTTFLLGSRFSCNNCRASYKRKYHLKAHLKYECGKEPQFKCYRCGKRFKRKGNLNQHVRVVCGGS
ncbi:zinc finger E-box-binding homeobox protein zag-1-like, partial [Agrilus planipennis]|uniref:Zinc finger E-box-binding homeobox protein zag-1-like n=1 Tax=Agrilus planipennis TaxID=224129 RepID=A0A1W4WY17_AGRPL